MKKRCCQCSGVVEQGKRPALMASDQQVRMRGHGRGAGCETYCDLGRLVNTPRLPVLHYGGSIHSDLYLIRAASANEGSFRGTELLEAGKMEELNSSHIRIATANAYRQMDVLLLLLRHLERKLIIVMSLKVFPSALFTQAGMDSPNIICRGRRSPHYSGRQLEDLVAICELLLGYISEKIYNFTN